MQVVGSSHNNRNNSSSSGGGSAGGLALPIHVWSQYVWPLTHGLAHQLTRFNLSATTGLNFFTSLSWLLPCRICGHHFREKLKQLETLIGEFNVTVDWFAWTMFVRTEISNSKRALLRDEAYCRATGLAFLSSSESDVKKWYESAWMGLFLIASSYSGMFPDEREAAQHFVEMLGYLFPAVNMKYWRESIQHRKTLLLDENIERGGGWLSTSSQFMDLVYQMRSEETWKILLGPPLSLSELTQTIVCLSQSWQYVLQKQRQTSSNNASPPAVSVNNTTSTTTIDQLQLTIIETHPPQMPTELKLLDQPIPDTSSSSGKKTLSSACSRQILNFWEFSLIGLLLFALLVMGLILLNRFQTISAFTKKKDPDPDALMADIRNAHDIREKYNSPLPPL